MDQLEQAQADAAAFKEKASRASEDLMRASKEIGSLRDELEKVPGLEAALDQSQAEAADLRSQLKAAHAALDAANKVAADNAVLIEAALKIKEGLAAL